MFYYGKGCEPDKKKAMDYYKEAAYQNHPGAQYSLGTNKNNKII